MTWQRHNSQPLKDARGNLIVIPQLAGEAASIQQQQSKLEWEGVVGNSTSQPGQAGPTPATAGTRAPSQLKIFVIQSGPE
jgi:hypothetical protein